MLGRADARRGVGAAGERVHTRRGATACPWEKSRMKRITRRSVSTGVPIMISLTRQGGRPAYPPVSSRVGSREPSGRGAPPGERGGVSKVPLEAQHRVKLNIPL
jgi:hypothetical protein